MNEIIKKIIVKSVVDKFSKRSDLEDREILDEIIKKFGTYPEETISQLVNQHSILKMQKGKNEMRWGEMSEKEKLKLVKKAEGRKGRNILTAFNIDTRTLQKGKKKL